MPFLLLCRKVSDCCWKMKTKAKQKKSPSQGKKKSIVHKIGNTPPNPSRPVQLGIRMGPQKPSLWSYRTEPNLFGPTGCRPGGAASAPDVSVH